MPFTKTQAIFKTLTLALYILAGSNILLAQSIKEDGKEFPIPSGNSNQLFYLQRNENINTLVYELNEQNGNLNMENLIHVFWILYAKNSQHEELSEVEKKFAYGIKSVSSTKEQYQFTLVAYPKISLQLIKDSNQKYHIYTTPVKQQMMLNRIYIKVKEGSFRLEPEVEYIEFRGTDVVSGKEITEQITP